MPSPEIKPEKVIRRTPEKDDYTTINAETERSKIPIFNIWYYRPICDRQIFGLGNTDPRIDEVVKSDQNHINTLYKISNQRAKEFQEDQTKRPFKILPTDSGDINGQLELAFDSINPNPPEIIIVQNNSKLAKLGRRLENSAIKSIRERIKRLAKKKGMENQESMFQPIIALTGDDKERNAIFMEQGADLIMPDFIEDDNGESKVNQDINELIQLVAKIKSDPASLHPEKVIAEKKQFYEFVEGLKMEDRSKITADTEQELEILRKILDPQKIIGNRKGIINANEPVRVIDVGCGSGRITNQLAVDNIFQITGLDSDKKLLKKAERERKKLSKPPAKNRFIDYVKGDLINFSDHPKIPRESQDAVIYTWHSFLEAFGPGNTLRTLKSAWLALRENGTLIFDQPTRENPDMADGWYYNQIDSEQDIEYLSYIMTEEEIRFMLKITGFEDVQFKHWQTKPSELYPNGMKKITVSAKKTKLANMPREIKLELETVKK